MMFDTAARRKRIEDKMIINISVRISEQRPKVYLEQLKYEVHIEVL